MTNAAIEGPAGFRDVALCGSGATSRVYRAIDPRSGAVVALKRLHRQMVRDAAALARLRRELDALQRLRHPSLCAVRDLVVWDGDPTIVMDFVDGEDLKARLVRGGPLPAAEAERIARALLDVLAMTHGSGIVHRDVKPQNVRLAVDGRVFLLDFGSARLDAASQLTTTGTTVGTPEYMAPELFAGSVYDPRVDLYGVGATLFECLTGQPPQIADSLAELATLRTTRDAAPVAALAPGTPAALARVVDRCLARAPEDRYPSAALAVWALDHADAERVFALRRSSFPPCLHCATPLPPEAALCAGCGSDHPFAYAAGPCHVVVRSVAEPARFIEHVVDRFPERNVPAELGALGQRCAALSFGRQRYVSFIADEEAVAVVKDLAAVGVRAETLSAPRFGMALPIAFGALSIPILAHEGPVACFLLGLLALAIGRIAAIAEAGSGILATSGHRLMAPRAFKAALAALYLVAAVATAGLVSLRAEGAWWAVFGALALTVGALVASRHPAPALLRSRRVQPGPLEMLWQSFTERRSSDAPWSSATRSSSSRPSHTAFVGVAVVCLLFFEGFALVKMAIWEPFRGPTPITHANRGNVGGPVPPASLPTAADPDVPAGRGSSPARGPAQRTGRIPGEMSAFAMPLAVGILLVRRRSRIRRDGAAIYAELDLAAFEARRTREAPLTRRGRRPEVADLLAHIRKPDGFQAQAVRRATEIARWLPADGVAQLQNALDGLGRKLPGAQQAESSLVARCILETDPEQKARFDFLALEGRLEAAAATAWARRLGADAGPA